MNRILELVADSSTDLRQAEDRIKSRLFSSPWFCYKYQVHRLRNIMPEEVGADLSGSAEGGIVYYPPAVAAELLSVYAGGLIQWVARLREDFPYTEGNLKFKEFTDRRLPDRRPVLFRGKRGITLDMLASEKQIDLEAAASLLIEIVENE